MVETMKLRALSRINLAQVGWKWLFDEGNPNYLADEVVVVSEEDVQALYLAAAELYTLLVDGGDVVIAEGRLGEMGIPERMHRLIEETWEDERQWHLLGRFDFAGGVAGQPPRLLEFNADTPTSIPETAILQWAQLKANGLEEQAQFNGLYEALVENFGRLKGRNRDLEPSMALTYMEGLREDEVNVQVLAEAASEAGFTAKVVPFHALTFSKGEGVFALDGERWQRYDFVFKLVPWEYVLNEPVLFDLIEGLVMERQVVVVNPPYALLLQSKRLLKVAWELSPGNPHLLETDYAPLGGRRFVEKVAFGREGANVTVYHPDGHEAHRTAGDYDVYPTIYQEFADLPHDARMNLYQAGVFHVHEPCALGFRRGGLVLDDRAQFVGHVVRGEEGR